MEYKLGVGDRMRLLNILPETGSLPVIRIVRELREGLSFSEAEMADAQVVLEDDRVHWQEGAIPDKVIDIGPTGQNLIREALGELDRDERLQVEHLGLVDLFEYEG